MNQKDSSPAQMNKLENLIYKHIANEEKQYPHYVPEQQFNPADSTQEFYKVFSRHTANQVILKHGYKLFRLSRHEQDLAMFCLSLLEF